MRVLFLSSRLPYPPIGGDRLKNYWLLKILAKHFKVHLVSLTDTDVPAGFYKFAEECGFSYKIFKKNKLPHYLNALKGVFFDKPIQVSYYFFSDIQDYINSITYEFDLIMPSLIRMSEYVNHINKPKILVMTDSIGLHYKNAIEKTSSKFWKILYKIEAGRLINYERKCIEIFDKVILVNKAEEEFFNNPTKTVCIPNGVEDFLLSYEKYNPNYENCVTFFGKMNYQPNIDAVLWFIKNVLPLLDKRLKFCIVGAYPPKNLFKLQEKYNNIIITGYLEDPYEVIKSSLCVVAPMQTGGGIQNKVLQSMALGTVNIISSLAATPIGGKNWEHYIVEDNPENIANIIHDIFKNPSKYENIKKNSRELIKQNFTWNIYEKRLLKVIEEVLYAHRGESSA